MLSAVSCQTVVFSCRGVRCLVSLCSRSEMLRCESHICFKWVPCLTATSSGCSYYHSSKGGSQLKSYTEEVEVNGLSGVTVHPV